MVRTVQPVLAKLILTPYYSRTVVYGTGTTGTGVMYADRNPRPRLGMFHHSFAMTGHMTYANGC